MSSQTALDQSAEAGQDRIDSRVGPWRLIAGKLVRQKVAMAAGVVILLLYLVGLFAEFLAPACLPTSGRNTPMRHRRASASSSTNRTAARSSISTSRATRSRSTRWRCAAPSSSTTPRSCRSASSSKAPPMSSGAHPDAPPHDRPDQSERPDVSARRRPARPRRSSRG
jgi:hypothetical protein